MNGDEDHLASTFLWPHISIEACVRFELTFVHICVKFFPSLHMVLDTSSSLYSSAVVISSMKHSKTTTVEKSILKIAIKARAENGENVRIDFYRFYYRK